MFAKNKWVAEVDGKYIGIALADTREEAEDWMDELAIVGNLLTREEYMATTAGQEEAAEMDKRKSELAALAAAEEAQREKSRQLKEARKQARQA